MFPLLHLTDVLASLRKIGAATSSKSKHLWFIIGPSVQSAAIWWRNLGGEGQPERKRQSQEPREEQVFVSRSTMQRSNGERRSLLDFFFINKEEDIRRGGEGRREAPLKRLIYSCVTVIRISSLLLQSGCTKLSVPGITCLSHTSPRLGLIWMACTWFKRRSACVVVDMSGGMAVIPLLCLGW